MLYGPVSHRVCRCNAGCQSRRPAARFVGSHPERISRMRIQPANRRLGILLSGRGSNFEAIADHIGAGKLNAEIAVVVSNRESAPGLERARARGLPSLYIPSRARPREDFDREVVEVLKKHGVSLV